jgi:hypothetical protein
MAGEQSNGHDSSRLDRIEGMMEVLVSAHLDFAREHKQLLTAQVVLTDRLDRTAIQIAEVTAAQKRTDEAFRHTDERLNALITIVDGIVRNPPHQAS